MVQDEVDIDEKCGQASSSDYNLRILNCHFNAHGLFLNWPIQPHLNFPICHILVSEIQISNSNSTVCWISYLVQVMGQPMAGLIWFASCWFVNMNHNSCPYSVYLLWATIEALQFHFQTLTTFEIVIIKKCTVSFTYGDSAPGTDGTTISSYVINFKRRSNKTLSTTVQHCDESLLCTAHITKTTSTMNYFSWSIQNFQVSKLFLRIHSVFSSCIYIWLAWLKYTHYKIILNSWYWMNKI